MGDKMDYLIIDALSVREMDIMQSYVKVYKIT